MTAAPGTRERLLDAALDLTREGGYAAVTVGAVAARAGVSAGALYRHWPGKGELVAELFRTVCARELSAMEQAASSAGTAADRIDAVLSTFAGRALHHPRLAWTLLAEPVDPLLEAERLAYRRAYRELVAGLLVAGVQAGELPAQDVDVVAAGLVGALGEALVGPISPLAGGPPDAAALLATLRVFARRAIGAPAAQV
ncbi:TetR/AcrR family transcriptional regulator [Paraconexibacter antarcticus]|uniref:TetR/AcrR family transcriptional regulator n=1 Tax=Paraconexibacter antarcticus TaxID=2949664 RepID=A0ABY5DT24_9ACTN|nr:TetR/AcrR family transcriptional regulator [Paraconexibacter antarcticus]UTI64744.1 TetR/AcrR family transcriptional regulator [Paraconexibacter antarcticus]